jgi:hypothetical protein
MKENTHKLGATENHMPPWGVVEKGTCCQFVLMLQKKEGCWSMINLTIMIKTTMTQLLKYATRVMVIVGTNLMPPKVIKWKACLQIEVFFNYQKILDPKCAQTFEKGRSQKK